VRLEYIYMIGLQPLQRFLHTFHNKVGFEIELGLGDSATLGCEYHFFSNPFQRSPQNFFAKFNAIIGAGIEEVNALVDGLMYGLGGFGFRERAINTA